MPPKPVKHILADLSSWELLSWCRFIFSSGLPPVLLDLPTMHSRTKSGTDELLGFFLLFLLSYNTVECCAFSLDLLSAV